MMVEIASVLWGVAAMVSWGCGDFFAKRIVGSLGYYRLLNHHGEEYFRRRISWCAHTKNYLGPNDPNSAGRAKRHTQFFLGHGFIDFGLEAQDMWRK